MLKKLTVALSLVLAGLLVGEAQITVPHTFTTTVPVSQLNTNFSTIADGALKRSGGNVTGAITADSGITIDGVDIGAVLGASSSSVGVFQQLTTSNTGATSVDFAGGITAGTGNVGIVNTAGKIPALSTTYLADLSASNLTIGAQTLPDRLWTGTTYTPTWAGGGVAIGDGTIAAYYQKTGRTVNVQITLTSGSTTNFGGATSWSFTLPEISESGRVYLAQVLAQDVSGSAYYSGVGVVSGGSSLLAILSTTAGSTVLWNATTPFTWASPDTLFITLTYTSAS